MPFGPFLANQLVSPPQPSLIFPLPLTGGANQAIKSKLANSIVIITRAALRLPDDLASFKSILQCVAMGTK